MALLLGSDYTIGVKGIGPVNATEAVEAFHDLEGLKRFKQWTDKGTFQDQDDMEHEVREYHHKHKDEEMSKARLAEQIQGEIEYKKKHRELIKHWEFPSGFPSDDVAEGYTNPYIDKLDGIDLSWGQPDFKALKELALNKLNWHPQEIKN